MEFISLSEAIKMIGNTLTIPDEIFKASEAAAVLHAAIHNSQNKPDWYVIDKLTNKALKNESVVGMGMEMLKHAAGWKAREVQTAYQTGREHEGRCTALGLDPDQEPMQEAGRSTSGLQWDWPKHGALRENSIGFERENFLSFLSEQKINASGYEHAEPEDHQPENAIAVKAKNTWDEYALRKLRNEYLEGKTQVELGEIYGVSRQLIGRKIKVANDRFGRSEPKSGILGLVNQTIKGRNY